MRWRREHRPLLYLLAYASIKLALKIFFQKIDVRHRHLLPASGPLVLVANHPNSIMDALVLGAVIDRKLNYIAHAGLFRNRLVAWFLRSCGVIPVYRREEHPDKMDENVRMFEACTQALEGGEAIGIFPEGVSDMRRKVKQVKTGAARIVLESEARHRYNLGVVLLPVGLHFYSRSHFRSRVLVNFGEPIELVPFIEAYRRDAYQGVKALTQQIQKRLEELTVNIYNEELDDFVRDIEKIYRDELRTVEPTDAKGRDKAYREEFLITKAIADCVTFYQNYQPERVAELQDMLAAYKRKLRRLHLRDSMLKAQVTRQDIWRALFRAYVRAAVGLLPALYGIINNFVPYRIAEYCGKRFLYERTKILSALLIGGGLAFLFFYTVQTSLVLWAFGPLWATLYLVSLPLSGFYTLAYIVDLRKQMETVSFTFYLFTSKHLLSRMKRERRLLITHLDRLRDAYLEQKQQRGEALSTK